MPPQQVIRVVSGVAGAGYTCLGAAEGEAGSRPCCGLRPDNSLFQFLADVVYDAGIDVIILRKDSVQ